MGDARRGRPGPGASAFGHGSLPESGTVRHATHRPPPALTFMTEHTFDSILDSLAGQQQRATYGAVAGVLNSAPRALMAGRPRDPRHSWIVSRRTGEPTGYGPDQIDPALTTRPEVLRTPDALLSWLRSAG